MSGSGVQPVLSQHLAASKYAGAYLARVDLGLFVDNGRPGQPTYPVSILAPRPVQNVFWSNPDYALTIGDGHPLNPGGVGNRIDVMIRNRSSTAATNLITFCMALDGTPFLSDAGANYVTAVTGAGPSVYRNHNNPDHANVTFQQGVTDEEFALRVTSRDLDDITTITVKPITVRAGASATFTLRLTDHFDAVTTIATATVVSGGATYTHTFDRNAVAAAIIGAGPFAGYDYSPAPAFKALEVGNPSGTVTWAWNSNYQYPFADTYALDLPNNEYNSGPFRPDLHFGNEADAPAEHPAGDRWLRNKVDSMDVTIVRAVRLTAGPARKRAHFQ